MSKKILVQNKQSWDTMADTWFGMAVQKAILE